MFTCGPAFWGSAASGGSGDPYFPQVLLLLHGDGSDGSTTVVDDSPNGITAITAFDGAAIDTDYKRFGSGSIYLDGSNDYVLINAWSTYIPQLQNSWTIEFEFRPIAHPTLGTGTASIQCLYAYRDTDAARTYIAYSQFSGLQTTPGIWLRIDAGGSTLNVVADATLSTTETSHIAVTYDETTYRIFINGTLVTSTASAIKHTTSLLANLHIGYGWLSNFYAGGWFDDYRITSVCRYTSSFTRPALPHPDA